MVDSNASTASGGSGACNCFRIAFKSGFHDRPCERIDPASRGTRLRCETIGPGSLHVGSRSQLLPAMVPRDSRPVFAAKHESLRFEVALLMWLHDRYGRTQLRVTHARSEVRRPSETGRSYSWNRDSFVRMFAKATICNACERPQVVADAALARHAHMRLTGGATAQRRKRRSGTTTVRRPKRNFAARQ